MYDPETKKLILNASSWQKGIANSPYVGVADMRNMDPHSKPGALLCGPQAVLESDAELFESFPRHAAFNEDDGVLYAGTEDGFLFRRSAGANWSEYLRPVFDINWSEALTCNGLMMWKGYLLWAETLKLHAFDIGSDWYDDWQSFEEGMRGVFELPHTMFVDDEDVVYITDGRWIASLAEVNGQVFDANDPATFTWNPTALDLPEGYVASTFASIGTYLVIGGYYGGATNRGNRANLFPWNRTDPSFKNPMRTKGNGVWQSITHNNEVFAIIDRKTTKLYATNLSAYDLLKELRVLTGENKLYPDAIEVVDNEILAGIGSSSAGVAGCGVYGFKNGLSHLKNTVSGGDVRIEIGSITDIGEGDFVITWTDGTEHGADLVSDIRTTGYGARLDTALFVVGDPLNKRQFQNLDVYLGRKLATGQGVRVWYRPSLTDDWTLAKEFTFATHGAVSELHDTANMTALTNVQIRIELTTAEDSTTSPEFIGLTLD